MADHESTMKWKVDIGQLTKAMQEAKRAINVANAEFKTATAGMDRWSKSTDGLEAKLNQLNKLLPNQKAILADMEKQYELTAENMGENSKQAQDLRIKIEEQRATIVKTETNIKKYNDQLNQMQEEQKQSETASGKLNQTIEEQQDHLDELKKAYKDAVLQYGKNSKEAEALANEIKDLSTELARNKNQMEDADKAADNLDVSLEDAGDAAEAATGGFTVLKGALANLVSQGISKAIEGIKNLARETFTVGTSFESGMSQVAAISGATTEELDALTAKAKEMGESTKFSASESAEAFNYMAMAGWTVEDMLGGIEGVMNLAAASGADLATTSDIVTDALTAMGYSASDAGKLADIMAAASSNANTNVEMMGQTFQYAAPIIGALGYEMEDAAVAIGLMANAGIKGEKAGTALRSILTRLSAPPKECATAMDKLGISLTDSEGNMKSMDEVIGDLRGAFDKLSETEQTAFAKQIAGQEAMSGLLAIVRAAPEDYNKLTKAVENSSGAAKQMADTMNDNVGGQITLLKSKIEGIMIKVFEKMSKSIRKALDTVSKALDKVDWDKFAEHAGNTAEKVAELFDFVIENGDTIISVMKEIAVAFVTYKAVSTITSVVGAFKGLFTAVKTGTSVIEAFNTAIGMNPYALAAAGIAAIVVAVGDYAQKAQEARIAQYELNDEQQAAIDQVSEMTDKYNQLNEARNESVSQITNEFGYITELKDEYNGLIDANGKVKEGYEDRAEFILTKLADALGMELDDVKALIDENGKLADSIDQVIQKKKAEALLAANEQMYNEAIAQRSEALQKLSNAQKAVDEAEQKYMETSAEAQKVWDNYYDLMSRAPDEAAKYLSANSGIIDSNYTAQQSYQDAKAELENAENAWIGYNATIQNYEGLAEAIISGDAEKINAAMANMTYNFITAETGNRESLERQVKNYETNLEALEKAIEDGTPGVTQEMLNQAKSMVDAANKELDKLPPEASATGNEAGDKYAKGVGSHAGDAKSAGKKLKDNAKQGSKDTGEATANGEKFGTDYAEGVDSKQDESERAGEHLADEAEDGSKEHDSYSSGSNFGEGFFNGIGSWVSSVWEKAKELAKSAWSGLKKGQAEGSPSKLTFQSGQFFGEGYELGIASMIKPVTETASNMAKNAVDALASNLNEEMRAIGADGGNSLIDGMNGVLPDMSDSINGLKASVASSNAGVSGVDVGSFASGTNNSTQNVVFNQTINSPKPVSRLEVYRQTNSLLFSAKVRMSNV